MTIPVFNLFRRKRRGGSRAWFATRLLCYFVFVAISLAACWVDVSIRTGSYRINVMEGCIIFEYITPIKLMPARSASLLYFTTEFRFDPWPPISKTLFKGITFYEARLSIALIYISIAIIILMQTFIRSRFVNGIPCRNCGYDLTGNVSGRCPECGIQCIPD